MMRERTIIAGRTAFHGLAALVGMLDVRPLWRGRQRPVVAFQACSIHLASFFLPVIRRLRSLRPGLSLTFILVPHPYFPVSAMKELAAYAHDVLGFEAADIHRMDQVIWEHTDVLVCTDLYAWFPPCRGRTVFMMHTAGLSDRDFKPGRFRRRLEEFDRILVPGDYDRRLVEDMSICRYAKTRVEVTGCMFLDEIHDTAGTRKEYCRRLGLEEDKRIVLIAPSWRGLRMAGSRGDSYLEDVYEATADEEVQRVVKLHGNSLNRVMAGGTDWKRELEKFSRLHPSVRVDAEIDDRSSLKHADVLITDISSRAFEFMALGKPVIQYFPAGPSAGILEAQRQALLRKGSLVAPSPQAVTATLHRVLHENLRCPQAAAVGKACFAATGRSIDVVAEAIVSLLPAQEPPAVPPESAELFPPIL